MPLLNPETVRVAIDVPSFFRDQRTPWFEEGKVPFRMGGRKLSHPIGPASLRNCSRSRQKVPCGWFALASASESAYSLYRFALPSSLRDARTVWFVPLYVKRVNAAWGRMFACASTAVPAWTRIWFFT